MKQFLIIGNGNAVKYKEIFPYIKNNKIWIGISKGMGEKMEFLVDKNIFDANKGTKNHIENGKCYVGVMLCTWFTNIKNNISKKPLILTKTYNEVDYPKYDNYDAIEVSRFKDIPKDYNGVMGVPITFMDKFCPSQFEIIGKISPKINGKNIYERILIKRIL